VAKRGAVLLILGDLTACICALWLALRLSLHYDELSLLEALIDSLTLCLSLASAAGAPLMLRRCQQKGRGAMESVAQEETAGRDTSALAKRGMADTTTARVGTCGLFDLWRLTPAEREVARAIVKGFSHKEVAQRRGTTEGTVRQQAHAVYRKAGLSGQKALIRRVMSGRAIPAAPGPSTLSREAREALLRRRIAARNPGTTPDRRRLQRPAPGEKRLPPP